MDEANIQLEERGGVWGWVLRHPKSMIALVLLLMAFLAVLAFQRVAENARAQGIAAIKAKGEPTTVQDLEALSRLRAGPNPLPDVLALVPAAAAIKLGNRTSSLPYVGTAVNSATGYRLPPEQMDAVRWYLDQLKDRLQAMQEAMRKGRGTLNIPWTTATIDVLIPELADIRAVARVHLLEVLAATEDMNAARTGELLIEYEFMLDLAGDDAPLIVMLVQIALYDVYMDRVERTINRSGLSAAHLEALQGIVSRIDSSPNLKKTLMVERALFIDDNLPWFQSATANAPTPGGKGIRSGKTSSFIPVIGGLDADMGLTIYTELIDAIDPANAHSRTKLRQIETKHASLPWYCVISRILAPARTRAIELYFRTLGRKRAMLASLAAERFRLANNRWPANLTELVPEYLSAVPLDPEDGKTIRYAIIPEGIKTWTVAGEDHNEDNGGDVRRLEPYDSKIRPKDFGWVILNPELRGRPAVEEKPPDKKTTATTKTAKE